MKLSGAHLHDTGGSSPPEMTPIETADERQPKGDGEQQSSTPADVDSSDPPFPLPLRLRQLPASFWQEPKADPVVTSHVSPQCTLYSPPLGQSCTQYCPFCAAASYYSSLRYPPMYLLPERTPVPYSVRGIPDVVPDVAMAFSDFYRYASNTRGHRTRRSLRYHPAL